MRSVVVVLPASMCAMIPMFRVFSMGSSRGMSVFCSGPGLPTSRDAAAHALPQMGEKTESGGDLLVGPGTGTNQRGLGRVLHLLVPGCGAISTSVLIRFLYVCTT